MTVVLAAGAAGLAAFALAPSAAADVPATGIEDIVSVGNRKIYSATEIAGFARSAGFDDSNILDAIAIALAESGGNANAYNPETAARGGTPSGLGSYGLWQIYLKAHPEFNGNDLTDPQLNANAAFSVYTNAGNSFYPWSTFGNRAYVAKLTEAEDGYNTLTASDTPPVAPFGDINLG